MITTFDKLTPHDLYKIVQLRQDVFLLEQNIICRDFDDIDILSYHCYYKCIDNNFIYAYLRIIPIKENEVKIGRVAVSKNYRSQGIGKKLMNDAISFSFNSLKVKKVKICAQAYLLNFYESLGFYKTSDPYIHEGVLHIDMEIINNDLC